jgi:tRNA-2-methylthio-N6-dimethylallyladenosine synthase
MNEYDTELIRSILAKGNYAFVTDEWEADVVMLNTCSIRDNADRKVYGRIHAIKHQFREAGQPRPLIGILGCMATNFRKALLDNPSLDIDFIAGPDSYKHLPKLIAECYTTGVGNGLKPFPIKPYDVTLSEFETYSDVYPARNGGVNAWIAVMRGCNNFCTFCVVPYTRGRERSRSVENVVEEVRKLAGESFKQVTLLGQNVNSYRHENDDFAALLEAVSQVEGIERIRFTSPHPKDFPERLLEVIAGNPKVCKHIHMPLQAGNNRVLDLMDRTYTQEEFLGLIEKTRRLIPGVALTTDIIVGFPTETDEEFEDTFKVMQDVEFDSAFIFKYSERPNTIASRKYPDDVPDNKKAERTIRLNDLQKDISLKKNRAHIGKVHNVLIEDDGTQRSAESCPGRTDGNKLVILPQNGHRKGDFVKVRITDATPHALKGNPA